MVRDCYHIGHHDKCLDGLIKSALVEHGHLYGDKTLNRYKGKHHDGYISLFIFIKNMSLLIWFKITLKYNASLSNTKVKWLFWFFLIRFGRNINDPKIWPNVDEKRLSDRFAAMSLPKERGSSSSSWWRSQNDRKWWLFFSRNYNMYKGCLR